jgi:hypothetical protein
MFGDLYKSSIQLHSVMQVLADLLPVITDVMLDLMRRISFRLKRLLGRKS